MAKRDKLLLLAGIETRKWKFYYRTSNIPIKGILFSAENILSQKYPCKIGFKYLRYNNNNNYSIVHYENILFFYTSLLVKFNVYFY